MYSNTVHAIYTFVKTTNMFIYNVTLKVQWSIQEQWLKWMTEKHLNEVMATNCFTKYQFVKLLDMDDEEGVTYAIQYYCTTKENYELYIQKFATKLRQEGQDLFGNQFIGFRSFMEIIN
jgi:hypothetical protein